jgi:HSP20 family protein
MALALASTFIIAGNSSAHLFDRDFFAVFNDLENKFNDVNMYKNKKTQKFTVEIALPGFDKKDIKVTIDNKSGTLAVTAEHKEEEKEEKKNEQNVYIYKSKSISQSYFHRTFTLPNYVNYKDANTIETTYKNGILRIEFPLCGKEKTNEVTLQISGDDEEVPTNAAIAEPAKPEETTQTEPVNAKEVK